MTIPFLPVSVTQSSFLQTLGLVGLCLMGDGCGANQQPQPYDAGPTLYDTGGIDRYVSPPPPPPPVDVTTLPPSRDTGQVTPDRESVDAGIDTGLLDVPDEFMLRSYDVMVRLEAGIEPRPDSTPILIDEDGDGFDRDIDCNDRDASIHPLRPGVNVIRGNVTICPGNYGSYPMASFVEVGADNIVIGGEGATANSLTVRNHHHVIVNRLGLAYQIQVQNSHDITLDRTRACNSTTESFFWAFNDSTNNDIIGTTFADCPFTGNMWITLRDTHNTRLEGISFPRTTTSVEINGNGNLVTNCTFSNVSAFGGSTLFINGGNDNQIVGNIFTMTGGAGSGISVYGNRNRIEGNTIDGFVNGMAIRRGAMNVVLNNLVRNTSSTGVDVAVESSDSLISTTIIDNNRITDNRGTGLRVLPSGTYIRFNDLRRNGRNEFTCEPLYCTGNTL